MEREIFNRRPDTAIEANFQHNVSVLDIHFHRFWSREQYPQLQNCYIEIEKWK